MGAAHPNFMEKTFTGGSKTAKYVNVFSLENFPLYVTLTPTALLNSPKNVSGGSEMLNNFNGYRRYRISCEVQGVRGFSLDQTS